MQLDLRENIGSEYIFKEKEAWIIGLLLSVIMCDLLQCMPELSDTTRITLKSIQMIKYKLHKI